MNLRLSGNKFCPRVAIFISGGGSTMQALLEEQHQLNVSLVVASRNCIGVLKAKRFGISVLLLEKKTDYEELHQQLNQHNINFIVLAGYMKILPEYFVKKWSGRIINIHPSLLPLYKGLEAAERSWKEQNEMGVSIHEVTPEMDEGKIVFQKVSRAKEQRLTLDESLILLRKTEQHLLRQVCYL